MRRDPLPIGGNAPEQVDVVVEVPVGVLKRQDEAGGNDPWIQHFFEHYKDMEPGKWVMVAGRRNAAEARLLISEGIARYAADQE